MMDQRGADIFQRAWVTIVYYLVYTPPCCCFVMQRSETAPKSYQHWECLPS